MAVSAGTLRISDPEELPHAAAALERYREGLAGVEVGVRVAAGRIERQAHDAVVQLEGRVRAAEQWVEAARRQDEDEQRKAEKALLAALRAARDARYEGDRIERALTDLHRAVGPAARTAEGLAGQGNRGLRRVWEQLGRASSAFAAALGRRRAPSSVADPGRITSGGGRHDGPVETLLDHVRDEIDDTVEDEVREVLADEMRRRYPEIGDNGRVLVPLEDLFDDGPVTGLADFLRISPREMQAGLRLLEDRILPALRRGGGHLAMEELDAQAGTTGSPDGFVGVYEAFFGGEERAVRAVPAPDGRLEVVAGHHRLWMARRLHLDALPVLVRGRK